MVQATKMTGDQLVITVDNIITNSEANARVRERVAALGYDAKQFAFGRELCEFCNQTAGARVEATANAKAATASVRRTGKVARAKHQGLLRVVRAIFPRGSVERGKLGVTGATPVGRLAFIATAMRQCNNALRITEISTVLAQYGYDQRRIQECCDSISAYQQALQTQSMAQAEAASAIRAHAVARDALRRWLSQYLEIAKVAMADDADMIKALNLPISSVPTIEPDVVTLPRAA